MGFYFTPWRIKEVEQRLLVEIIEDTMMTLEPIKVLRDRRLTYLMAVENSYKELGYSTKLNTRCNMLEVYQKGYVIEKTDEEMVIEKWTN